MAKRVSQADDYLPELAAALETERSRAPDVTLPWSWWKEQAERFHRTPNNIYRRAITHGLYTPPSDREEGRLPQESAPPSAPSPSSAPLHVSSEERVPYSAGAGNPVPRASSRSTPSTPSGLATRVLTERLRAMTEMAELIGGLEGRIAELEGERDREQARAQESLRALDRLSRVLEEAARTVDALRRLNSGV